MMPKKQILVVEDNWINREMLIEILSDQYRVLEAENGLEALDVLQQNKDEIALILLDVQMPVMDGFAFLDKIKADNELSLIPVIVVTQSDSEVDEVAALAHGATDFVSKPYRPQVILHRMASIINLRETAAIVNQFQYDRLTGLYSKEFFYQKVKDILRENPEQEYAIVSSNIENFKLFNDAFGASEGDRVLKNIADVLQKQVGRDGICGRFGADRFLCLQEKQRERADRMAFASSKQNGNTNYVQNLIVKWGIYEITDRSVPVEKMCDRALLAVDSIKGQYNRYFAVYDDALRGKLLREQAITEAMETALDEGQFVVYLQPKYNLHDDRLAGAEALVRWNHPAWGFLSPGEFIPLFEKNGFITQLDQYVWEQACALMKTWNEKGYPALPVSVNVSRSDIYQSDLAQTLLKIVHKYGLEPKQLHLELTESAYTENPNQIVGTVDHLRKLGFIIEMDDFGSGYSSLNMLNRMKLDVLKLDMKFIQSETAKPMEQGILRFVVGLGHWLNLSVVAEGVETREQLERLREVGCDYAQGYFFSKPMLGGEFENLMKAPVSEQPVFSQEQWQDKMGMRKILIADEDAEYRKRVCGLFKNEYQVIEASDAAQAIDCIKTDGQDPISAVIVSAALPDQGALSLLSFMRRDPMLWHIPVLATLPQAEGAAEVWMQLDTDDFLCKRHPLVDLKRRVRHLLRLALSQERERILKNEACQDYLTGLLNRRGFYTAIDTLRQEDLPLAMYLFDLDNLKKVNDQYGHEKGDEMIRSFGNLLHHHTQDGDILCRYGGDEFVVILRRISSENAILRKGAEICEGANRFFQAEGIRAGCSGGIALCREDDKPSARLIEQADKALYKAKQAGKGRCCLWEE